MTKFLYTLALCLFMAAPALAVKTGGFFRQGPAHGLLFSVSSGNIGVDNECLPVALPSYGMTTCDQAGVNELSWPRDAIVTGMAVRVVLASDAAADCRFAIEVAGTVVSEYIDIPVGSIAVIDSVYEDVFDDPILLEAGDVFGIQVDDGDGGTVCTGTVDPIFVVDIFGYYVQD